MSTIDECGATPYTDSTPALPPTVKSFGGARFVSTSLHHLRPLGGLGSVQGICGAEKCRVGVKIRCRMLIELVL
jgi:hypothetical protein